MIRMLRNLPYMCCSNKHVEKQTPTEETSVPKSLTPPQPLSHTPPRTDFPLSTLEVEIGASGAESSSISAFRSLAVWSRIGGLEAWRLGGFPFAL